MAHIAELKPTKRLPDIYFKYAKRGLREESREIRDRITVRLPQDFACAIEIISLSQSIAASDVLKQMLVDDGILDRGDVTFSKKGKRISRYLDKMQLDKIKEKRKTFHLLMSEYARIKVYRAMIAKKMTVSEYFEQKILNGSVCKYCPIMKIQKNSRKNKNKCSC